MIWREGIEVRGIRIEPMEVETSPMDRRRNDMLFKRVVTELMSAGN
jgi:hypothetical protein